MNVAQFAQFWQSQGHRILHTGDDTYWYNPQPLVYMSLPYHRLITPSSADIRRVFFGGPSVILRYPTHPTNDSEGGIFLCSRRDYDFPALHSKARNQTRRALERCTVDKISFSSLAQQGHALNAATLSRQGRDPKQYSEAKWRLYCEAASRHDDFEAWGAFVDGQLAAFMVTALVEDYFSILHQSSAAELLEYQPNNALLFSVTKWQLARPEVNYVSYGLKSIDKTDGLNHFKVRMGFDLIPLHEAIVVNPFVRPAFTWGREFVQKMSAKHPGSDFWRKADRVLSMIGEKTPSTASTTLAPQPVTVYQSSAVEHEDLV